MKIGRFIAEKCKAQGLTQAALAEHLNIAERAASKWENGGSGRSGTGQPHFGQPHFQEISQRGEIPAPVDVDIKIAFIIKSVFAQCC